MGKIPDLPLADEPLYKRLGKRQRGTLGPREISRAERELRYANSELSFTRSVVRVVSNESNIESKMVIVS